MAFLVDDQTRLLIQGITGKEGQRALEWAQLYGMTVAAGVTPGKGGETILGVPVYNSVSEALTNHPEINTTSIYAPPRFVQAAAVEAIAAGIKLIHIIAEEVPTADTVAILRAANRASCQVIGPASIGVISPGKAKLGSIGGATNNQFTPGRVALISKSGGMCSEIALLLTKHGFGQSTVVGIGGNIIVGTTYADLVEDIERDPQTLAVIIIGEIGGSYEENLATKLQTLPAHKSYVAFISGQFAETLPQGMSFGHAGAIVDAHIGTRTGKIKTLQSAGVTVVANPSAIIEVLQEKIGAYA